MSCNLSAFCMLDPCLWLRVTSTWKQTHTRHRQRSAAHRKRKHQRRPSRLVITIAYTCPFSVSGSPLAADARPAETFCQKHTAGYWPNLQNTLWFMPSVLLTLLVGRQEGHPACKKSLLAEQKKNWYSHPYQFFCRALLLISTYPGHQLLWSTTLL